MGEIKRRLGSSSDKLNDVLMLDLIGALEMQRANLRDEELEISALSAAVVGVESTLLQLLNGVRFMGIYFDEDRNRLS